MKKFYVTFGCGTPLKNHYLIVYAESEEAARKAMNYQFKTWAFIYTEEDFNEKEWSTKWGAEPLLPEIVIDEDYVIE